jgi:hypothetical protein
MTAVVEGFPSYYQPGSHLRLLSARGTTLEVVVLKAFTPFTMAQVILATHTENNENLATNELHLPKIFVLKVYDPRFYSHRLPDEIRPARPWTLEAERASADARNQQTDAPQPAWNHPPPRPEKVLQYHEPPLSPSSTDFFLFVFPYKTHFEDS